MLTFHKISPSTTGSECQMIFVIYSTASKWTEMDRSNSNCKPNSHTKYFAENIKFLLFPVPEK